MSGQVRPEAIAVAIVLPFLRIIAEARPFQRADQKRLIAGLLLASTGKTMTIEIRIFELAPLLVLLAIAAYGIYTFILKQHTALKYIMNIIYFYVISFTLISVSVLSKKFYAKWRIEHLGQNRADIVTNSDQLGPLFNYYNSFLIHDTATTFWFLGASLYSAYALIIIQLASAAYFIVRKLRRT